MDPLLRQVCQTLQDYHMLEGTRTLLVAVSGGPDSMALLYALWELRCIFSADLRVAHLNHHMRPSGAADAQFVERIARSLGIRCVSRTIDVPSYQRLHKLSPEDAARQVRYGFLQATAVQEGADRIAVGHTADDQAETLLLRLLRGAGLKGLSGIPPVRERIIRPLIRVQRREIVAFLTARGIPFREDPSNQERHYLRNRVRLDLLPQLKQGYNPRVVDGLCAMADLLAADEEALQAAAREAFHAACLSGQPGQVCLRIAALKPLPAALQRRVLRESLAEAAGGLQGITHRHISALLRLLHTGAGHKQLTLPRGVHVERRPDVLLIHRAPPPIAVAVDVPFPIPGTCRIEALGIMLVSRVRGLDALNGPFPTGDVVWLDAAKLGRDVRVRTRRAGDRFHPLGLSHVQKLKAFLIDHKIPRAVRDRLPLLVSEAGIAWVVGVRIAEWAKVTPATRHILILEVSRPPSDEPLTTGM
ncbi:MAG: tRNA lysidine(34) synthetase TilS [Nitrospinae bacterium]|nr:tRNA lysidine(34) synthetase TilS [Nitrospinota bacterium]